MNKNPHPNKFYVDNIKKFQILLSSQKRRRNLITLIKVSLFILIVYLFFLFLSQQNSNYLYANFISIFAFIIANLIDIKLVRKINTTNALINCSQQEVEYLQGDFQSLDKGEQYTNPTHPYSFDLDIFGEESLFQSINRTVTQNGSDTLARLLLQTCTDSNKIIKRQEAIKELAGLTDWCHRFRATGSQLNITLLDNQIIEKWKNEKIFLQRKWFKYAIYSLNLLTLISLCAAVFSLCTYFAFTCFFFIQLFISILLTKRINRIHNKLGHFIKSISNYIYLIECINEPNFNSSILAHIQTRLFKQTNSLSGFKQLNKILGQFDGRANILVSIALNGLILKDVHTAIALDKWKEKHGSYINDWVKDVSLTDALVSMGNYRFNHPQFVEARISEEFIISATSLGHPLLNESKLVTNDFNIKSINNLYIITGANMSGKSTFLRAIGINLVLAQAGNVVCSKDFSFTPINLFTSMRTTDNLTKGISYFQAELLRLKLLIEEAQKGTPMFIILDEMLKGTNSKDKLNGSFKFLKRLIKLPVSGLVATHDLELGTLKDECPENFFNACFEIDHSSNNILYNYKIREGISQNMNASILMKQMKLL